MQNQSNHENQKPFQSCYPMVLPSRQMPIARTTSRNTSSSTLSELVVVGGWSWRQKKRAVPPGGVRGGGWKGEVVVRLVLVVSCGWAVDWAVGPVSKLK